QNDAGFLVDRLHDCVSAHNAVTDVCQGRTIRLAQPAVERAPQRFANDHSSVPKVLASTDAVGTPQIRLSGRTSPQDEIAVPIAPLLQLPRLQFRAPPDLEPSGGERAVGETR